MRKVALLLVAVSLILSSYAQNSAKPDYKSPTGLVIHWVIDGNGDVPQPGDKLSVHYTGWLIDSTKFDSSRDANTPFSFKLGRSQVIQGWDEAFALLRVGDRAILTIPPSIAYGDQQRGQIPANATLIFDVELLEVAPGIRPFDVAGHDTIWVNNGIGIIRTYKSQGDIALSGQKVSAHYTGFFRDGSMFDSSVERGTPFDFVLGKKMVIPGFDIAFLNLSVGDSARLIIPYNMAYGEKGVQGIPPMSDLIFDVVLLSAVDLVIPGPYDVTGKDTVTTQTGLKIIKIHQTQAPFPINGSMVKVHYTGYLMDMSSFDASYNRGMPIDFELGSGRVIPGWEEGISLMRFGEKARLIIPYQLAYGEQGRSPIIPPKADLIFDVYLMEK